MASSSSIHGSRRLSQANRESKRPRLLDSDDEDDQSNNNTSITWRMDPKESLSDWTIIVTNSSCGSSSATYHVHKNFLAVGRGKCDYFTRLFQQGINNNDDKDNKQQFAEYADSTSRFDFEQQKVVDIFPEFLDFLYYGNENQSSSSQYITIDNSIAMYSLAEYFGCRHLRRCVRRFFEANLTKDTSLTLYVDAKEFKNEQFMNEIVQYFAMDIRRLNNDFLNDSDHVFWLDILNGYDHSSIQSKLLSLYIASFCVRNRKNLNLDLFIQLTDESKLPNIYCEAAPQLMAVEYTLLSSSTENNETESTESTDNNSSNSTSSLQRRCEDALFDNCCSLDLDRVARLLDWVDSKILFRLLQLFQTEMHNLKRQVQDFENEYINTY